MKRPTLSVLAVLAGLFLELRHAVEPAHPRDAIEDPAKFGMFVHLALVEQDRAGGIDPARDIGGRDFPRCARQFPGIDKHGDRVHVHDAIETLHIALQPYPVLQRAQIIAEVQVARRLHAGEHEGRMGV